MPASQPPLPLLPPLLPLLSPCICVHPLCRQVGLDGDKLAPPPSLLKPLNLCSSSADLLVGQKVRGRSLWARTASLSLGQLKCGWFCRCIRRRPACSHSAPMKRQRSVHSLTAIRAGTAFECFSNTPAGVCHRQPIRPRSHAHHRRCQRHRAGDQLHLWPAHPGRDPDRLGHQPGCAPAAPAALAPCRHPCLCAVLVMHRGVAALCRLPYASPRNARGCRAPWHARPSLHTSCTAALQQAPDPIRAPAAATRLPPCRRAACRQLWRPTA